MKLIDNGGAFAIKGFNFQKASIALIAIKNFDKSNFQVYVEAKEDFQVEFDQFQAFIQVKSKKLTLNKILNNKELILYKNIISSKVVNSNTKYKIITKDFSENDLRNMVVDNDGEICAPLYTYNEKQFKEIINKLNSQGKVKNLKDRLRNSYIYVTPFKDNMEDAVLFLIGAMDQKKIEVSKDRGKMAINELFTLIDQKSELIIEDHEDMEMKKIVQEDLKEIFKTTSQFDALYEVLRETSYNYFNKERIKKEQLKILSMYKSEKAAAKNELKDFDLDKDVSIDSLIKDAIQIADSKISFNNLEYFTKVAIVIELLIEKSETN
ncbi:hypothetical protein [Salibacterium aidingense]|uniref:hypothetical protein n=1 Tax=Salibacterium aidingense TaxID=384933 RepID=UPI000402B81E|nr:hypothetical protein [Salibacterium aidingense]